MKNTYNGKPAFIIVSLFLLIILWISVIIWKDPEHTLKMLNRSAGLYAYLFIFLAIVSSEYMSKMKVLLGSSFMKVHHFLARAGILLMLVHPISFAIEKKDLMVFVPVFYPPITFLELAGRPALYLFLIAALAAVYRKKLIKKWKNIHYLNYLAFILVSMHAMLIGTDIVSAGARITVTFMALLVTAIFFHKRLGTKRKSIKKN